MIAIGIASVDNLQRDCRTASDAVVIGIEAACGELIAATAGASTIRLTRTVKSALEKLLIDGAVIDASAPGPLPGILPAVTGATLEAIVLWLTQRWSTRDTITKDSPKLKLHHPNHLARW